MLPFIQIFTLKTLTGLILASHFHSPAHAHDREDSAHQHPSEKQTINLFSSAEAAAGFSVSVHKDKRIIETDSLPDHQTGDFPNAGNPHQIKVIKHRFEMPITPQKSNRITELTRFPFGIALNGVVFDPGTAEYWQNDRNWRYEAMSGAVFLGLDSQNAHVQPNGMYHYHGMPVDLIKMRETTSSAHSPLVGFAADGFPIYGPRGYKNPQSPADGVITLTSGYQIKSGQRPSGPGGPYDGRYVQDYQYITGLTSLDSCNNRFTKTPDYPNGTYAYFITETYPIIPRCLIGTPDSTFVNLRAGGGNNAGRPTRRDQQYDRSHRRPPPRREHGNRHGNHPPRHPEGRPQDAGAGNRSGQVAGQGAGQGRGTPPGYSYIAQKLGKSLTEIKEALQGPPARLADGADILGVSKEQLGIWMEEAYQRR